jgi:hypothetical protein
MIQLKSIGFIYIYKKKISENNSILILTRDKLSS